MSNEFYNATPNVPPEQTQSDPETYTAAEFAKVAQGFEKFPPMSGSDRHRLLKVNAAGDGLAFDVGIQEKAQTVTWITIGGGTVFSADELSGYRLDPNGYYRFVAFFPFGVLSGSGNGLNVKPSFTVTPAWVGALATSGNQTRGTMTFNFWRDSADPISGAIEAAGVEDAMWVNGVFKSGATTGEMSINYVVQNSGGSLMRVYKGSFFRLMRLD